MSANISTTMVGVTGLIANITLEQVNTSVAIAVGLATLTYMILKIYEAIKNL